MNKFQAMARIMAILSEDGRLPRGSEKYKIARQLIATRIERMGPDAAYINAKLNKNSLMIQIQELHRLRGMERF